MCNKLWGIMEKLKKASKTFRVKIPESLIREKKTQSCQVTKR